MIREKVFQALGVATMSALLVVGAMQPQCARAQTGQWVWTSAGNGSGPATSLVSIKGTNGGYGSVTINSPGKSSSSTFHGSLQLMLLANSRSNQTGVGAQTSSSYSVGGSVSAVSLDSSGHPAPPPSGLTFTARMTNMGVASAAAAYINNPGGGISLLPGAMAMAQLTGGDPATLPGNSSQGLPSGSLMASSPNAYPPGSAANTQVNTEMSDSYGASITVGYAVLRARSGAYVLKNGALLWGSNADQVNGSTVLTEVFPLAYLQVYGGSGNCPGAAAAGGSVFSQFGSGAAVQYTGLVTITGTPS